MKIKAPKIKMPKTYYRAYVSYLIFKNIKVKATSKNEASFKVLENFKPPKNYLKNTLKILIEENSSAKKQKQAEVDAIKYTTESERIRQKKS